jgi:hypothetical protein
MENRRRHPRHEVQVDGKLILANGSRTLDCVILDISEGGARVSVGVLMDLPKNVYLWQPAADAVFECEVRWREAKYVGLRFVDTCGRQKRRALLAACVPPERHVGRIARWLAQSKS